MHDQTGDLFLVREIDLESLPATVLSLQIQVKIQPFFHKIVPFHPHNSHDVMLIKKMIKMMLKTTMKMFRMMLMTMMCEDESIE